MNEIQKKHMMNEVKDEITRLYEMENHSLGDSGSFSHKDRAVCEYYDRLSMRMHGSGDKIQGIKFKAFRLWRS